MKIIWIIGGLNVPHIGGTHAGETTDVPEADAHSLVKQGIAEYAGKSTIKKSTKGGK